MENIESDFIETAIKLRDSYKRKLQHLEGIISEWPGTAKSFDSVGPKTNKPQLPKFAGGGAIMPPLNASVTTWIIYAIQANHTRFSNPIIKAKLNEIAPEISDKISGGRISTQLYHLAKDEQISVLNKIPGGATEYQTTEKFKPWTKWEGTPTETLI